MLPKSLHTVRILVAIATESHKRILARGGRDMAAVMYAADVCGYPDASPSDPLIVKAAAQLAAQTVRAVA